MKSVLLVDDDPIILKVYGDGLSRQGFHVTTVTDGLAAVQVLRINKPDVVVLDLMMPKLSGVEVLKFMRGQKELEALPVIVLSNAYMDPLVQDAAGLGAYTGLLKVKCNPTSLAVAIEEVLAGKSVRGNVDQLLAASPGPLPARPTSARVDPVPAPQEARQVQPTPGPRAPDSKDDETDGRDRARHEFLSNSQAILGNLRQLFNAYQNARDNKDRELRLQDFYRRVHFVTAMAGMSEYRSMGQLASAFEALLFAMLDKLPNLEPSLDRTTSMAFEFLQTLLERPPDFRIGLQQNSWVLVVDDDRLSNRLVVSALRNAQLQARGTEDPETAMRLLRERHYDLVLLDIEMPGIDGIELCKRLRALPGYEKTPVIYVTLHSDFETQAKTVLSGVNDLIAKPILPNELAVKVVIHLLKNELASQKPR
jgi:CheY-like chemotaxis protein